MSHKKPVSRRDFLAQGLGVTGTAILMMPTLQHLLAKKAIAAAMDCSTVLSASTRVPFLCFDLAGGGNIAGSNVIVGKQGGQKDFLTNYLALGLPDGMRPQNAGQINEEFGLAFHSDSGFLRGMLATTTAATRANVDGVVFCTASNDDTSNNPFNPTYWIAASGTRGGLAAIAGTSGSESGGNSVAPPASLDPVFRPVRISNPNEAIRLVQTGKLVTLLSTAKAERIGKAIERLSSSQMLRFSQADLPSQLRELVRCGYVNANEIQKKFTADSVDPTKDADVTAVFTALGNNGGQQRTASTAKLLMDGTIGSATVELGGYDYHTGNRSAGEAKDEEAGRLIGQSLELARRKGKPLMIFVFTDGSVGTNGQIDNSAGGRGKTIWTGDDGEKGAVFCLIYRPGASRASSALIRGNKRQIGWYRDAGKVSVDRSATLVSNDVTSLAKAVVANYLALHGEEGRVSQVLGADPFAGQTDQYLAFTQIK